MKHTSPPRYVHFVKGKDTVVKFANPMPLADKYHARVLAVVVEGHYWCRSVVITTSY